MKSLRRSRTAGRVLLGVTAGWLLGCGSGGPLPRDGGAAGAGGAGGTADGGSNASGGASGIVGAGVGGSTILPNISGTGIALFDATTEGFMLDGYHDTGATNLADATQPANPPPTLTFDGSQGSPAPGSLLLAAPFSGANQYVGVQKVIGTTSPANWSGRILHVRIRVSQGTFKGGVQVYVKTGAVYVFGGSYTPLATGSDWQELTLNVDRPLASSVGYDPGQIVAFGIQPNSGSAGAGSTPVTFNIDSFWVDPPLPP